jgi:hypothetical protein
MYGSIAGANDTSSPPDGISNGSSSWTAGCTRDTCTNCPPQGTVVTGTNMGSMWVNGNTFDNPVCDVWSTVALERSASPSGATITTTVTAANLKASLLPDVGTHYRTAAETALLTEIGPIGPTEVCGNNVREGLELCDGTDFGTDSCQAHGYAGGTLTCVTCSIVSIINCTTSTINQTILKGVRLTGGTIK